MKSLFLLIALCPLLSFSQVKKDKKILVTPADTSNLYDRIYDFLKAEGYDVGPKIKNSFVIATNPKIIGEKKGTISIFKFRFPENTIIVSGYGLINDNFAPGGVDRSMYHDIYYEDSKHGKWNQAWQEMDRLARLLGTVTYSK